MNVLLVGSGAREHAIAWKLRRSPNLDDLFVAPGNPGTAELGTNLAIAAEDLDAVAAACREHKIDLAVVASDDPLAAGMVDRIAVEGVAAFGPTKAAAEIEWSKVFSKELMRDRGIPTAPFGVFDDLDAARSYVESQDAPLVVKAEGLTRGKGVIVTSSRAEALEALETIMGRRKYGESGARVVIEERLHGREVTAHAFTDGQTVAHMPFSCDHKPVFDGDRGPNTGGMGAYSPPGWLSESDEQAIRSEVTEAAIQAMFDLGRPYRGVLYPGVLIDDRGIRVLEYNSRFGDPEAQVLLPRLESDLLDVMWAVATNRLHEVELRWSEEACVGVVLASGGYPAEYETGLPITGLDDLDAGIEIFHAGTRRADRGELVTAGGRVLTLVAMGTTLEEARERAYRNAERVRFDNVHYRRDIGAAATPVESA